MGKAWMEDDLTEMLNDDDFAYIATYDPAGLNVPVNVIFDNDPVQVDGGIESPDVSDIAKSAYAKKSDITNDPLYKNIVIEGDTYLIQDVKDNKDGMIELILEG